MTADDELKRLEREIENRSSSKQAQASSSGKAITEAPKRRDSFDLILLVAAALVVLSFGANALRQMPEQQARTLADGALGGAAGVLIGYAIGRFRP